MSVLGSYFVFPRFKQDKTIFDLSVKVKKLLYNPGSTMESLTPTIRESHGGKLPRIDIALFNGDLLDWQTFWEQFDLTVHSRRDVPNAEKLAYLRHAH